MAGKNIIRSDPFAWGVRWIQLILAIVILALTGHQSNWWHQEGCKTPSDLALNISAAAITLPAVIYLLFSSGQKDLVHILPWNRYVTLWIDLCLLVLWIITTIFAPYDCRNLCKACSAVGSDNGGTNWTLNFRSLSCQCISNAKRWLVTDDNLDIQHARSILEGRSSSTSQPINSQNGWSATGEGVLQSSAMKMGLDGAMLALILSTLIWTAVLVIKHRKSNTSTNSHSTKDTDIELEEPDEERDRGSDIHVPTVNIDFTGDRK